MSTLAIIIPAYKETFLDKTLESLSEQTDKNFAVYIGDDKSPYDIKGVVDQYSDKLNITYVRFEENMGGRDLVAQWERCIKLCHEEWIWLFSDDDYMSPNCVELFKKELKKEIKYDVYRYNVNVIDRNDEVIKVVNYPEIISAQDIYIAKLLGRLDCYVVEFIFSREVYERQGGFVYFDLAWGSDLATWIKYGKDKGIKTIDGATIFWRSSGENISTIQSEDIVIRKIDALISFLKWGESNLLGYKIRLANNFGFANRLINFSYSISKSACISSIRSFTNNHIRRFILMLMFHVGRIIKKRK